MKIDRRHALKSMATAAATAALGLGAGCRRERPEPPFPLESVDVLVEVLRDEYPYLTFRTGTLRTFAERYLAAHGRVAAWEWDEARSALLLSTDFFEAERPEERELRFRTLYAPYLNPCYNPLVR